MSSRGSRVYVGRLSSRTRKDDVMDMVSKFGKVHSCDIKDGGYGFVEFEDTRDAEDAVKDLDGRELDGARIIVEFARGRSRRDDRDFDRNRDHRGGDRRPRGPTQRGEYRLAIEGLPRDMSWQDLKDHFRKAGDIVFADVYPDRSGRARGIVEYRRSDDLKNAIREFDDTEIRGNRITVKEQDDGKDSRRSRRSPSPKRHRSRSRSRSPRRKRSSSRSPKAKRRSRTPEKRRSKSPEKKRDASKSPDDKKRDASKSPERKRDASKSPIDKKDKEKSPSPKDR